MTRSSRILQAVIDAEPLFSAPIVNHLQNPAARANREHLLDAVDESVRAPGMHLPFLEFLAAIPEKLTTSHVVGEVNGLAKSRLKLYGPESRVFWNGSIDLLMRWNFDERLVALLDFAQDSADEIVRAGVVDIGLIRLAQRSGAVLITGDERTLAPLAREQGVDCELLRNLL